MFTTHRPTLTIRLHNFDLFRTCRTALLRGNWQDFNWHDASRGPSAIAELLVGSSCHRRGISSRRPLIVISSAPQKHEFDFWLPEMLNSPEWICYSVLTLLRYNYFRPDDDVVVTSPNRKWAVIFRSGITVSADSGNAESLWRLQVFGGLRPVGMFGRMWSQLRH